MTKIRDDFEGTVVLDGGVVLVAGDVIPDGVHVGGHLTEDGRPANVPTAPVTASPVLDGVLPLDGDEKAAADDLGILRRGVNPECVRAALAGYLDGWNAAVVELGKEQTDNEQVVGQGELIAFDPADHNAVEVHEYIAAHPDEKDAVLALEAAGKNRSSLLAKYQA